MPRGKAEVERHCRSRPPARKLSATAMPRIRIEGSGRHTEPVASEGTVRQWSDERGFGVIDSADTPGGCWFHFSCVVTKELASPRPGDQVTFTYETLPQDGFSYRA